MRFVDQAASSGCTNMLRVTEMHSRDGGGNHVKSTASNVEQMGEEEKGMCIVTLNHKSGDCKSRSVKLLVTRFLLIRLG